MLGMMIACSGRTGGVPLSADQFAEWFIAPSARFPEACRYPSGKEIDSLVSSLRKRVTAGNGAVVLHDTAGIQFTLGIETPGTVVEDTLYPCIIYLHGGIGTQRNDKGVRAYEMLSMLNDSMDVFIASPSANRSTPWWSPGGLSRILQTLRYMMITYPIHPDKIFLAGVSDGATGCWAAANTIASPFAGFFAISGFGGMLPGLGMRLYPQNLMQRPIYSVHAGNDRLYPVSIVNKFLDRMEEAGVGVLRKIYRDEEHGFDYRRKECARLCSLVTFWKRPVRESIVWDGDTRYPVCIDRFYTIEFQGTGSTDAQLRCYRKNDTVYVTTGGICAFGMYFENETAGSSKVTLSVNKRNERLRKSVLRGEELLVFMKSRCRPVSTDMDYLKYPL